MFVDGHVSLAALASALSTSLHGKRQDVKLLADAFG